MPYKVTLTTTGNQRTDRTEICHDQTPSVRDIISVTLINGPSTKAIVTGVQTFPSKSFGTAVESVDHVDAQEM